MPSPMLRFGIMRWIVPILVVVDVIAMIWLSSHLNVWVDEAYSLHTTSAGLASALRQSLFFELQPPVYFILLTLWRGVSTTIFFARLFSILCTAAMLLVAAAISRRLLPDQSPAWLVLALAANPFVIVAAVEIRLYAFVLLLAALLMYLFIEGYASDEPRSWTRYAYLACATIALYTQYYLGFLIAGQAVALLSMRRWKSLRDYCIGMVAVIACTVPIAFILKYQIETNSINFSDRSTIAAGILRLGKIISATVMAINWIPSRGKWVAISAVLLFTIAAVTASLKKRKGGTSSGLVLSLVTFSASVVLFGCVVTIEQQPITDRYAAGLLVPAFLALYALIGVIPIRRRVWVLSAWTIAVIASSVASLLTIYRPMAKMGDWQRVAAFVQSHERPGQPIIVFESQAQLPLQLYYSGTNTIVPLPRPMDFQRYDLRTLALSGPRQVSHAFAQAGRSHRSYWLVTTYCRRAPIDFKCEILDRYVAQNFTVKLDRQFFWSRVRLLERASAR